MKKRLIFFVLPLCAWLLGSCAKEGTPETVEDSNLIDIHLSASCESTRSVLGPDMHTHLWAEGDKIAVFDGGAIREFTLVSGAGTSSAVFTGRVSSSSTNLVAVSPYSAASLKSRVVSQTVPSEQAAPLSGADPAALVMRAECARGETLKFSNQTSLMVFSVPEGVSSVVLTALDGGVLAGESSSVRVTLGGGAGQYAAVVNPGEYNGISVVVEAASGTYYKSSSNTVKAQRSAGVNLGAFELSHPVVLIKTPEEMASFLKASSASYKETVLLDADIDLSGTSYQSAAGFAGSFDGCGHTVSGVSAPLFADNTGSVVNFSVSGSAAPSALEFSPVALSNHGSISNVTSAVDFTVSKSAAVSGNIVLGGIAAYNYGTISGCTNSGTVAFNSSSSIAAAALGGIAGYSEGALENCTNTGKVSLVASHGTGMAKLGRIEDSAASVGGIAGAAFAGFSATGCVNEGEVEYINDSIEKASAVYQRIQVGGIAGSPYGDISNCRNSARIAVSAITQSRAAFSAQNYILDVGGISGGSFHETGNYQESNDHTNILDCVNEGDIDIKLDATKSNSPIGGIVGWPNGEKTGVANKVSGCVNSGNITVSGAGKMRVGGVMGGTGFPENCSNSGRIYLESADANSCLGGIAAFHSQDHKFYGCVNTGDVISKIALFGVGGLIGCHGGVNLSSAAACKVLCNVESGALDRSGVGIVLGTYNKETSKNVVLGSEEEPIEVRGNVTAGGRGTELNAANFKSFLSGTSYASSTHIIYAYCDTPAPADYYFAEGSVTYSDGSPASGVSVSDGFSVAVTAADGSYKLTTTPDSYYIYISVPADAEVGRKVDGRPDFFTRYTYPSTHYDFVLKRQDVEKQFLLFALADPQAHYAKRSGQTIADTDRFIQEAVPGMNSHIAAQSLPCYGVTLGDIVYSESSRNSNPGMNILVSHFQKLNMPVFQTMGNHDYTYFYTSKPLALDDGSSTLYLRAQRAFEEAFGPINFSFNRGDVHVICMRNIIYDSNTDASSYHCGYTDAQWEWIKADLANVPKTKMVIICGHIPLVGNTGREHVTDILNLIKQYKAYRIFSGHTHYKRYAASVGGVPEHIHAAVCGTWWWSNVEGDGTPNGYTVYKFDGTSIKDEYSMGFNTHMNTRDYQMRVYRGNIKTGGSYAKFNWGREESRLMINVFNGDSRWNVKVYENGALSGTATLMNQNRHNIWSDSSGFTKGATYDVNANSSQDWWAIGYHIGVRGRGTGNTSYFTSMFHMYTYLLKDPNAEVKVVATDGYGNSYTATEVISTDYYYPAYMKQGNVN